MMSAASHGDFGSEVDSASVDEKSPPHPHHGIVGRKSKNKLRPTFSSSSLTSIPATPLDETTKPLGSHLANFSTSSTFSRLKGYQFYQYLHSLVDSPDQFGSNEFSPLGVFSPSPQHFAEMRAAVNNAADNQSFLLHKLIQESLTTDVPSYSSSSSVVSGIGGSSLRPTHSSLSPAPSYNHSAISLHGRYHGLTGSASFGASGSGLIAVSSSAGAGLLSGPVIQKNPTHVAALQEQHISPDTLITPAIVIKNKEERELRLRSESCSVTPSTSTATISIGGAFASKKQQQITIASSHPNVISVSSSLFPTLSSSTGVVHSASQRSAGISPFSPASAFGNIHLSGSVVPAGSSGAVLRYTTPLNISVSSGSQHKILHQPGGTGLLRRVGSAVSVDFVSPVNSGTAHQQQVYTVPNSSILTTATWSGSCNTALGARKLSLDHLQHNIDGGSVPPRISSFNPPNSSEMLINSSSGHVLSTILPVSASSLAHRTISLASAGSSPVSITSSSVVLSYGVASISPSITTSGSGITVLAASRSFGPPVGIYPSSGSIASTGVTLLTANKVANRSPNQIPQMFRPRNTLRNTNVAHKFIRTLSTSPGQSLQITGSSVENPPNGGRFLGSSVHPVVGLQHGALMHRGSRDHSMFKHIIRSQSGENQNSHNFISLSARQRIFPGAHSSLNNNNNSLSPSDDSVRGIGSQIQNSNASAVSPRIVSDVHLLSNIHPFYSQRSQQSGGALVSQSIQRNQQQLQQTAFKLKNSQYNAMSSQRNQNNSTADHNQNPPAQPNI